MEIKVVIAGGNGFIGNYFRKRFEKEGFKVVTIGRNSFGSSVHWDDDLNMKKAINNCGILINLAGKSVNCRYNAANKAEIISSRVNTTKRLSDLILQVDNPPQLWLNASTATIYRHAEDHAMTENEGEIGTGFSVEVAQQWEKSFFENPLPHTRRVALRMTIVLGKNGGVINPLTNLVKCLLGGKQGNGRQMFSWIHIEDLFRIVLFTWENKNLSGVINCASPNPVSNQELMGTLRKTLNIPFGIDTPAFLLKIGAVMIGTETELILKKPLDLSGNITKSFISMALPND